MRSTTFAKMLADLNVDMNLVKPIYESISDQICFPELVPVTTGHSLVDGLGVFVTQRIQAGDEIAPVRVGEKRTPAGRYLNHADEPNAGIVVGKERAVLVAKVDIEEGEEVFVNYRDVLRLKWA